MIAITIILAAGLLGAVIYIVAAQRRTGGADGSAPEADDSQKLLEDIKDIMQRDRETLVDKVSLAAAKTSKTAVKDVLGSHEKVNKEMLDGLSKSFGQLSQSVQTLNTDIGTKQGRVSQQIENLSSVTAGLSQTLGNSKKRGSWGENLLGAILDSAGFQENLNYFTQKTASGGKIDFLFPLPQNRALILDVKFPWDNYKKAIEAEAAGQNPQPFADAFYQDVKNTINELSKRSYSNCIIEPEGWVPMQEVLMYVPNDSVFGFLLEHFPDVVSYAKDKGILLCHPLSFLATLNIIRELVEKAELAAEKDELIAAHREFSLELNEKFIPAVEKVGENIERASDAYEKLSGTRLNVLKRTMRGVDKSGKELAISISQQEAIKEAPQTAYEDQEPAASEESSATESDELPKLKAEPLKNDLESSEDKTLLNGVVESNGHGVLNEAAQDLPKLEMN